MIPTKWIKNEVAVEQCWSHCLNLASYKLKRILLACIPAMHPFVVSCSRVWLRPSFSFVLKSDNSINTSDIKGNALYSKSQQYAHTRKIILKE